MEKDIRVIVSGGGTGGHIFPAVSIANAIKAKRPNAEILFVGALGRMEMQRVQTLRHCVKTFWQNVMVEISRVRRNC